MKMKFSRIISDRVVDVFLYYLMFGCMPVLNVCLFVPLGLLIVNNQLRHLIGEHFSFFQAFIMACSSLGVMCILHLTKEIVLQSAYHWFGNKISHWWYAKLSIVLLLAFIGISFYFSYQFISPSHFHQYGYYYLAFVYTGPLIAIQSFMDEYKEIQEYMVSQTK